MKAKKRKVWQWATLLLLLLGLLMPVRAEAAQNSCTVTIPVEIELSGGHIPGGKTYMATLSAVTKAAPVPAETIRQREGVGELKFGPITYTRTGEYQYRISQNTDSAEQFTYDREAYLVTVQVTRTENGTLETNLWAKREGKAEKADGIRFKNRYDAPKSQNSGSSGSGSHQSSVRPVQTGDAANIVVWLLAAVLAAGVIVLIVIGKRNRNREKKERIYRQRMSVYR